MVRSFVCGKSVEIEGTLKENNVRKILWGHLEGRKVVVKISKECIRKEGENMSCAKRLGLDVPEVYGSDDYCLIIQYIEGDHKTKFGLAEYERAVGYLARLHSVNPDRVGSFKLADHYCRGVLRNRLNEELGFLHQSERVIGAGYDELLEVFTQVLQTAYNACDSECVLGHGDFKSDNLIFTGEKVIPIDWKDFGFTAREYELGALLFGEERPEMLEQIPRYYLRRTGIVEEFDGLKTREFVETGLSVAYAITTGSHFRLISLGESVPKHLVSIEENTKYIKKIRSR